MVSVFNQRISNGHGVMWPSIYLGLILLFAFLMVSSVTERISNPKVNLKYNNDLELRYSKDTNFE